MGMTQAETATRFQDYIKRVVDEMPPFTQEQLDDLASIMQPTRDHTRDSVPGRETPPVEPVKPVEPRRCALYRHYDNDDVLLYVGISYNPMVRGKGHAKASGWVRFASRIEAEWLDSRADAEDAEVRAIETELPLFNGSHALHGTQERRVKYLVKKGAYDMLRPE